jgi:hypothetical protein
MNGPSVDVLVGVLVVVVVSVHGPPRHVPDVEVVIVLVSVTVVSVTVVSVPVVAVLVVPVPVVVVLEVAEMVVVVIVGGSIVKSGAAVHSRSHWVPSSAPPAGTDELEPASVHWFATVSQPQPPWVMSLAPPQQLEHCTSGCLLQEKISHAPSSGTAGKGPSHAPSHDSPGVGNSSDREVNPDCTHLLSSSRHPQSICAATCSAVAAVITSGYVTKS